MAGSLNSHELDACKNVEENKKLMDTLNEMQREYKSIEASLEDISYGQDNLYARLDSIEQQLQSILYNDQSQKPPRTELIDRAKALNTEVF